MKKYYLFLFVFICLIFSNCQSLKEELQRKDKSPSAAYEALNMLGHARTYPNTQMPDKAHFAAWKKVKPMMEEEKTKSNTDPWESMGPHNRAGRTLALVFNPQNPNTLYAGSASGGLWRSYTAGKGVNAWERVDIDLPVLAVSSIAFAANDSMTMYIGTGEVYNYVQAGTGAADRRTRGTYGIGVLKSTDGGTTWTKSLDWSYAQNRGIWSVEVHPQNPDIVYAGTTHGVYKSIDAGANWNQVLDNPMVMDLIIHPNEPDRILVGCGNLGSENQGMYYTHDGGLNWIPIVPLGVNPNFQGKIQLAYAPSNPDIVYASIGNGFWFDDGATWLVRNENFGLGDWELKNTIDYSRWQGWFAHDVAVSPNNPDVITCVGIEVWRSTNAGETLTRITSGGTGFSNPEIGGPDGNSDYVHSDAHDVIYHPTDPNRVFVASDGGISESENGGLTYHGRNGRYQSVQFYNGFSNSYQDSTLALGGLQDNNTIIWNGDKTWQTKVGGDGSWTGINVQNDNMVYASSQFLNIARSQDGGQNFPFFISPDIGNENVAFIAPYVVAQNDPRILYAGAERIYKSTNQGDFWQPTNSGAVLDGNPAFCMEVAPSNDNVVYVGTAPVDTRGNIFVTLNGGVTWANITQNLPDRYPTDVTVDPNDEATAYVVFSGFETSHVFKTQNYGSSWQDISGDLPDVPTNAVIVDPYNSGHIYVGNDIGIFVSTDGGATWEAFQDGLPPAVLVFDLKISPSNRKLRVATHGNGAFQRDLIEQEDMSVATQELDPQIAVIKVFPNPTTDFINLSIELKQEKLTSIRIFNLEGKIVHTINNLNSNPQQNHLIPVKEWVAGQYFCHFELEKYTLTKSFIVIK